MSHPPPPLPAHQTKNEPVLHYPVLPTSLVLALTQSDAAAHDTTGSTLWLGAQVLAAYLFDVYAQPQPQPQPRRRPRLRAIDLGAGVGLTAHALAVLGFDVLATDVRVVVDTVLARNVAQNAGRVAARGGGGGGCGVVEVRELDWLVAPCEWDWSEEGGEGPLFDLVVTADTLYRMDLVVPLVRTIKALSVQSRRGTRSPPVLLALERRDPDVIDKAMETARSEGFACRRVADARVAKCIRAVGIRWQKEDWEGVEIWRWVLKGE